MQIKDGSRRRATEVAFLANWRKKYMMSWSGLSAIIELIACQYSEEIKPGKRAGAFLC
jgi:hypothetical protein